MKHKLKKFSINGKLYTYNEMSKITGLSNMSVASRVCNYFINFDKGYTGDGHLILPESILLPKQKPGYTRERREERARVLALRKNKLFLAGG